MARIAITRSIQMSVAEVAGWVVLRLQFKRGKMLDRDYLADRALAAEARLETLRERLERASAEGDTGDAHFANELLSLLNEPTEFDLSNPSPRPRRGPSGLRRFKSW